MKKIVLFFGILFALAQFSVVHASICTVTNRTQLVSALTGSCTDIVAKTGDYRGSLIKWESSG